MIDLQQFLSSFSRLLPTHILKSPWNITRNLEAIVIEKLSALDTDYIIKGNVAIHKQAQIEEGVVLKGPAIIGPHVFVAAHAYLRGGVLLDRNVIVGPGCEVKSSIILERSALAHFNFLGDSIVGSHVNIEAGVIVANHHNDREDKEIFVMMNGTRYGTGAQKFGALIGDHSKIGANAVLSPGTILMPRTIVPRLQLVNQCPA